MQTHMLTISIVVQSHSTDENAVYDGLLDRLYCVPGILSIVLNPMDFDRESFHVDPSAGDIIGSDNDRSEYSEYRRGWDDALEARDAEDEERGVLEP